MWNSFVNSLTKENCVTSKSHFNCVTEENWQVKFQYFMWGAVADPGLVKPEVYTVLGAPLYWK